MPDSTDAPHQIIITKKCVSLSSNLRSPREGFITQVRHLTRIALQIGVLDICERPTQQVYQVHCTVYSVHCTSYYN